MLAAQRFLRRFVDASREAKALDLLGQDPDGFGAVAEDLPDAFKTALDDDAARAPSAPAFVNPHAFASAACDESGAIVEADKYFRAWALPGGARASLGPLSTGKASVSFLVEDQGKFVAVAAAPLAKARGWPLAPEVRTCLERGAATIAVIARLPVEQSDGAPSRAASVLGFTGLEARVVSGLVQGGNARSAAQLRNVSYETARDALKSAMRKAGTKRQSELVSVCMRLEAGEAPSAEVQPVLQDLFGLTERQAHIALSLARGATRAEAATALSLSDNVVKAELKLVFAACLVDSAPALCRIISQLAALTALASAVAVDFQGAGAREPLRVLPRADRAGRIAFADHGPADGVATLFLHSATTGRHLPESYIARLQKLGLRPITLDRPGYGLTDMVAGDYLDASAHDLAAILDHLDIERASLVCRSGAIAAVRFAQLYDTRLRYAVLINPEPPARADTRFTGLLGGLKRLVHASPDTVAALVRTLSRRATPKSIAHVVRAAVRHSPADNAMLDDPDFMAGFIRASQQAAIQEGVGFMALERCVAMARSEPGDTPGEERFHILCGAEDDLHAGDDAHRWWRDALPNAVFHRVENAGRFLHAQRPDLIASALVR